MPTDLFFSMSVSGSKVSITPYDGPYIFDGKVAYTGPVTDYTDAFGNIEFDNVIAGTYKVTVSNANASTPPNFINYSPTVFYIILPETSGSLVNGNNYIVSASSPSP